MSRLISRAEGWEQAYTALQSVNFAAFDFTTVKQSLLDYIKLHFPETFNDYIESSELVAIVEAFAYVAELVAYRIDVTAHENFISTAQRRDSILRLAKLVSYSASRPLPARGLVKITSVSTTENVLDINGADLANRRVRWNDISNPSWKEQFILVMNRVLEQDFGSVGPFDRFQIQDVLFELYGVEITPLATGVFPYSAVVNGDTLPMELVPISHDARYGIVERRPENNVNFTLAYGSDGVGDSSETTGFFCYTKQGTLQRYIADFDGISSNLTYDIEAVNVNDTDVWVNAVEGATRVVRDDPPEFTFRRQDGRSGEWKQVDLAHAQNIIFNTNPNRNKYEVETRDQNKVRLVFGDGEFADVPSGSFDVWVRTSADEDVVIPQTAVVNQNASFTYLDNIGRTQTFTFTFTLVNTLQNASAAEDIEHVRNTAPAVYYTQDRMVNGEDYNVFMLQDPTILKLRAVNRTFAGDSNYAAWHDASQTYENVKIFSDDGFLYLQNKMITSVTPPVDVNTLIINYMEPLLSSPDVVLQLVSAGVPIENISRVFSAAEKEEIQAAMLPAPARVDMYYDTVNGEWRANKHNTVPVPFPGYPANFIADPVITLFQPTVMETKYEIGRFAKRLVIESSTTAFWNTNSSNRVVDYDTLISAGDDIVILQANVNNNKNGILTSNWHFDVVGQESVESGTDTGLPDVRRLSLLPADANEDGIPDDLNVDQYVDPTGLPQIIRPKMLIPSALDGDIITLPAVYIGSMGDIQVFKESAPNQFDVAVGFGEILDLNGIGTQIQIIDTTIGGTDLLVVEQEYVYFNRLTVLDPWVPVVTSYNAISSYKQDLIGLWRRFEGRDRLNFAWLHNSPRYHLVDPSPTNIIDAFVITKGYYNSLRRWLEDPLAPSPIVPTPLDLRTSYDHLLDNKMVSDTVVLHPGNIKLLFGNKAIPELTAKFVVVRAPSSALTDNQIKTAVVSTVRNFFDIARWEFGETFYFTELSAAIHMALPSDVSTVVLVPSFGNHQFGDLYQVAAKENELFCPDISVLDVELVSSLNAVNMRL